MSGIQQDKYEFYRKYWDGIHKHNIRYEGDGYPPDQPGVVVYNVTYPAECWGCGYKKGSNKCPYCGNK